MSQKMDIGKFMSDEESESDETMLRRQYVRLDSFCDDIQRNLLNYRTDMFDEWLSELEGMCEVYPSMDNGTWKMIRDTINVIRNTDRGIRQ